MTRTQYEWNDTLTISSSSASGTYILQAPAITTTEDGSGTIKACTYDGYDGINPGTTGYHTTLTRGLLTREDRYATNCTPGSLSGLSSTQRAYDTSGNLLGVRDPDGQAGVPGHVNSTHCTISSVAYSACAQFDSLYSALPTVVYNALDQATTLNYTTDGANTNSPDATNGWGTWLTTSSDANGAATAFGYDALGRLTALAKPSDTLASSPTTSYQYVVTCAATGAAEPCTALQTTQRLTSGGQTVTSATYYDGWGRPVEAVTPEAQSGSTCTFAVQYTMYDSAGRVSFQSDPYFTTGLQPQGVCMPRYMRPDRTQPGSSTEYDGLDRTIKSYDAFQHLTSTSYSEAQPAAGAANVTDTAWYEAQPAAGAANVTDTAWYEATTVVDANGHQRSQLTDGFGRARYGETFTGDGTGTPAYTLYGMQAQTYDWLGNVLRGTGPNPPPGAAGLSASAQTTATYDLLGRKTALTDADLGSYSFPSYDANGNLRESVDPRGGTSGTVWIGYDGLNRPMWRNTTNTPTGAYVTYTYDETTQTGGHGSGIGRLTTESFSSGQSLGAGSYSYSYDARGQQTGLTVTLDGTHTFGFAFGYTDAGQPSSVQYSDGETLTYGYSAFGWLTSATLPGTTLATTLGYSGVGGAAMKPTSASVGNGTGGLYTFSASYDDDLRLSSMSLSATSGGTTLYATSRGYDAVGNVASVGTTLAAGTDQQAFCYDEQNRLVWASSQSATGPCGQANTAGTLSAAAYTATYVYDALNRLTSATAQGSYSYSYSYGDPAHLHAATATSSGGYSATYDLAGDLTSRAPNSAVTCAGGSPTSAVLTYDTERRMVSWASAPSNPGATAGYAYDGEGHRVAQSVTAGGSTTTTYYVAGLEEQANVSGGTSTLAKYYLVPGVLSAVNVGGTLWRTGHEAARVALRPGVL